MATWWLHPSVRCIFYPNNILNCQHSPLLHASRMSTWTVMTLGEKQSWFFMSSSLVSTILFNILAASNTWGWKDYCFVLKSGIITIKTVLLKPAAIFQQNYDAFKTHFNFCKWIKEETPKMSYFAVIFSGVGLSKKVLCFWSQVRSRRPRFLDRFGRWNYPTQASGLWWNNSSQR